MRYLLAPLAMLGVWAVAMLSAQAGTMLVGENFLGGPQSVTADLAAYGGTVHSNYYQSPTDDGEPNRVRLLRYPWRGVTQAEVTAMTTRSLQWWIANEVNVPSGQDSGMQAGDNPEPFVRWYHDQAAAIRGADPTAKIAGPSVLGWAGEHGITPGRDVYDRLWAVHQQLYGAPPVMDAVNLHYYPPPNWFYNLSWASAQMDREVNAAADWATAHGKGLVLTEWSYWNVQPNCAPAAQTATARYGYVQHGLQTMAGRGVQMALWFANREQPCDQYGMAASLFNPDNSLTVEGMAHRDFVQGAPVATSTLAPAPTLTRTLTLLPSPTWTRTAFPTTQTTLAPTQILPQMTATLTRTPAPCIPTFIRKCP